jgi:hypothetical protein
MVTLQMSYIKRMSLKRGDLSCSLVTETNH